jgi:hypothetical protein
VRIALLPENYFILFLEEQGIGRFPVAGRSHYPFIYQQDIGILLDECTA